MDNTVEFVLDLQDKISAKLKTIGINNETMLEKWAAVEKKLFSSNKTLKDTGNSIGSLNDKIAALRAQREWIPSSNTAAIRATNHEIERLEKQVRKLESLDGGRLKKWAKDITGSIPAFVNPLTAIGTGIVKSVQKGMENELQKQNLATLLGGDMDAADTIFGKLSEYGKNTVYDKAGLIEAQKTMMSFGITADDAFGHLKQIGDIAMGDSQKMQSLALAFSQASSAGKLGGQDLMQMINAGFNPLQVISEKTGKSMATLKDEMAKGLITTEMMAQAFQWATEEGGMFYNGAEKAGQTLSGRMNQFRDSVDEMLIAAFAAIEPVLSPLVDFATAAISKVGSGIQNLIAWFKEGGTVVNVLAIAAGALAGGLLAVKIQTLAVAAATQIKAAIETIAALKTLGLAAAMQTLNLAFLTSPIFLIVATVIALVAAIVLVCRKITGWGSLWDGIMGFLKNSAYAAFEGIKLYFSTLINGIMIGLDKIKLGWYKFKEACGIGDSAENQAMIAQINADVEERQKAIVDGAKKVKEYSDAARDSLKGIEMGWKGKDESEKAQASIGTNAQLQKAVNGGNGGTVLAAAGSETAKSTEAVATGGTRKTDIHINLKSLVEQMNFNGTTAENIQEIKNNIAQAMLQALNMAQASVS